MTQQEKDGLWYSPKNYNNANNALKSTSIPSNNGKKADIPDSKNQNIQNFNGMNKPSSKDELPDENKKNKDDKKSDLDKDKEKNKDDKKSDLDKDKEKNDPLNSDKKNQNSNSALSNKDNDNKSIIDKFKDSSKKSEKNNKLNNKIKDKAQEGLKQTWKALPFLVKLKLIGFGILIIVIIFVIGLFFTQTTGSFVVMNNITQSFVYSMYDPLPENSWSVSETYGWRLKSLDNGNSEAYFNKGINLMTKSETEVYAVQPGTITEINENNEDGKYVIVDHNVNDKYRFNKSTYKTKYTNLSSFEEGLEVGDNVVKMTILGYSKANDIFHFEVIQNDVEISLNKYFGYADASDECKNMKIEEKM